MAPDTLPFCEPLMNGDELRIIRLGLGMNQDAFARALGFKHGGIIRAYERGYLKRGNRLCRFTIPDATVELVKALVVKYVAERKQKRAEIVQLIHVFDYSTAC